MNSLKNSSYAENADDAVIVALGSNLKGEFASCWQLLQAAIQAFPAAGLTVVVRSQWWRSKAWPDDQAPDYLNGAVRVSTALSAEQTLQALQKIETQFGRRRSIAHSPRTLDLDLIAYGRMVTATETLSLPHPRASNRRFVMGPIAQISPGWIDPVRGISAAELFAVAEIGRDAFAVDNEAELPGC